MTSTPPIAPVARTLQRPELHPQSDARPHNEHARAAPWRVLTTLGADPRHFQIIALTSLLSWGVFGLHFELHPGQVAITLSSALLSQWICARVCNAGPFEPRSALISGLSLCLLLRVDAVWMAALVAAIAITSKFALRWRGNHLFNPTAFAISAALLVSDSVWVASGQWGHAALALLVLTGLGLVVLTRAQRLDIAAAFAVAWSTLILLRLAWYHDPLAIAVHQLSNGAVVLFCLFMLTDPRTTPRSRAARVLFAIAVALVGAAINFGLYRADGLILALTLCAPLTVCLNRWLTPAAPQRSASPSHPH